MQSCRRYLYLTILSQGRTIDVGVRNAVSRRHWLNNRKRKFGLSNLLSDPNTNVNSMINRRVSLFYRYLLEASHHMVCPCTLYLVGCLCSVSRHQWTGWSTIAVAIRFVKQKFIDITCCLTLIPRIIVWLIEEWPYSIEYCLKVFHHMVFPSTSQSAYLMCPGTSVLVSQHQFHAFCCLLLGMQHCATTSCDAWLHHTHQLA